MRKKDGKRKDSHAIKIKEEDKINMIIMFYIHAHFDLSVWYFSPWIQVLIQQYMQCMYASFFITKAPHKPIINRKEGKASMPW